MLNKETSPTPAKALPLTQPTGQHAPTRRLHALPHLFLPFRGCLILMRILNGGQRRLFINTSRTYIFLFFGPTCEVLGALGAPLELTEDHLTKSVRCAHTKRCCWLCIHVSRAQTCHMPSHSAYSRLIQILYVSSLVTRHSVLFPVIAPLSSSNLSVAVGSPRPR